MGLDPQGDDVSLLAQSPLYDATTTYPGPPAQTGQLTDSHQRVSFRNTAAANWHTPLNPPISSGNVWIQFLEFNNGDWTFACCDLNGNSFPVMNINTIFNTFEFILNDPLTGEKPPNTVVPIFISDYLLAFDPIGGCCIGGFHTADSNTDANGPGIRAWTWADWIPQRVGSPFGFFALDVSAFSHEIDELYNDPFINTNVSPWIDGSVSFAQGNLETGDTIELMNPSDVIYNVPLNTSGGPYTYGVQNEANLEWFTRNPFNGGIYSWPNTHTLGQAPHPVGCTFVTVNCYNYGQGSAAFFYGPPY